MDEEVFPHWFFGPGWHSNSSENEMICETEADVPAGWVRSPTLLLATVAPTPEPEPEPEPLPEKEPATHQLDHDGDGLPGGSTAPESTDRLKDLRAEYQTVIGKRPFPGWDEAELERRIAEHTKPEIDITEF